ncbi:hypothetical protein ABER23_07940 [Paenibacillus lautus]|uniref:hypothetical protein n=1 Tax=Paenibacillus lautus TaxID=1401 RepID=UPI003D2AE1B1
MNNQVKLIDQINQINRKISGMNIQINKMHCYECFGTFYELEGHELERCPLCSQDFANEPNKNSDDETYYLIVDPVTGVPNVIRDCYDPDTPPVPTIKPGDTTKIKFNCRECDFECVVQYDSEVFVDIDEGHCPHCGNADAVDLEVVE